MISHKRHQVARLRTETEFDCQLKEKTDVEIAEVGLYRIKQHDILPAPVIKPRL